MAPAFGRRRNARKDRRRAHCPFKVTRVLATTDEDNASKQRELVNGEMKADLVQPFPFYPQETFNQPRTMGLSYSIKPEKLWLDMTRFRSFVLNGVKYFVDDFVYIANDTAIDQYIGAAEGLKQSGYWVAKVLEIRASDDNHANYSLTPDLSSDDVPPYAILSHTWGQDEVVFTDLVKPPGDWQHKASYEKIKFCAKKASRHGL